MLSIPSPFARENKGILIQPLSIRYRDREETLEPMVRFIWDVMNQHEGNFLVFFPSYSYMNQVLDAFRDLAPDVRTIIQDTGMSESLREDFLAAFEAEADERLVGFALLGGVFSEGVDLKGDRLSGVIIVGVGLPQIGMERDIIKVLLPEEWRDFRLVE